MVFAFAFVLVVVLVLLARMLVESAPAIADALTGVTRERGERGFRPATWRILPRRLPRVRVRRRARVTGPSTPQPRAPLGQRPSTKSR